MEQAHKFVNVIKHVICRSRVVLRDVTIRGSPPTLKGSVGNDLSI